MAEADWSGLTAPLRRAAQALGASNGALQHLGNDRAFWARWRGLNELPACIAFHPFADTQQWSVDLEQDQRTGAEQAAERQAWSPRLTRQARRREQIALVSFTAPVAGTAATATRGGAPMQAASSPVSRDGTTATQRVTNGPDVQSTGAWSALVQITQLLAELEPETPPRGSSPVATATVPARRASRTTRQTDSAAHGRSASQTATSAPSERSSRAAYATSVQATPQQPTALLEQYVAMLWADAGSPAPAALDRAAGRAPDEPPAGAGPAPRAPSLLLPARSQSEARAGSAALPPTAADAALPPVIWPANDEQGDESVEERLNRALLEQAWLRGVDLT